MSEYLDTFLKFQARRGKSYIQDTKDFLKKLDGIKSLPANSILVTMDVSALYTNIDHSEGAQACFEKLEQRNNPKVPSTLLKKLILLVLKSNIFRFNEKLYKQIKGTAMGTPMAVNYANIFLEKLETKMMDDYEKKTKLRPFIWIRYIDDIFFIWNHGEDSLKDFIKFCDNYSSATKMSSNIRYVSNTSKESVEFLDVIVKIVNNKIQTCLFTKKTDAHLYLTTNSCHPAHVIKNIPKGQLIRVRRICSEEEDFDRNAKQVMQFFKSRGYVDRQLQRSLKEVKSIPRKELLGPSKKTKSEDPNSILVCTWHPKLSNLPAVLKKNYDILDNDPRLRTIFTDRPTVAFRRKKNLANLLCKNDVREKKIDPHEQSKTCKCQVCKIMSKSDSVTNPKNGLSLKLRPGGNCKSTGIVYAVKCKKCNLIYVGHSGNDMCDRYGKHKYDIKKRPDQNELATHCHQNHDVSKDLEIYIVDYGIPDLDQRKRMEDKVICKLQTMGQHGLNELIGPYAKEMYATWTSMRL